MGSTDHDDLDAERARRNIAALGLIVIAGLWLAVAALAWRDHRTVMADIERDQSADLAVMRSHTLLLMDVARQIARRIEDRIERLSWDEIEDDELLQQTLEGFASGLRPQVAGIHLIDEEGRLRVTSRLKRVPTGESRADRRYFEALKQGWTGPFVEHATGRITGARVMVIAFPMRELTGEFRGATLVSVATSSLDAFFDDVSAGYDARLILTRSDGMVVREGDRTRAEEERKDPLFPRMAGRQEGTFMEVAEDGKDMRVDFVFLDNAGLYLRIEREIAPALAVWRTETARNGVFAVLLSAFAAAFVIRNRRLVDVLDVERRRRAASEADLIQRVGEIEAARKELEEARRTAVKASAAKTEFLASMSHEIRTPMNGILGFVNLLRNTKLDGVQAGYVARVVEAGKSLQSVLDEVLDFSKLEAGELRIIAEPFELPSLVDSVVAWGQVQAEHKGVSVAASVQPAIPRTLIGDAHRLKQILMNLMSNALKFTESGSIVVDVRETVRGPEMIELRFSVKDTGLGIAPEDVEKLFNAFSQVGEEIARHREGTGLGLAICRKLVEIQGGRIGVDSTPGRGSVFWFDLEFTLRRTAEAPAREIRKTKAVAGRSAATVLVVDDVDMNRELVSVILSSAGYHVEEAETGPRALQKATRTTYDLILMDVQLGDTDGLEITRALRRMGGHWTEAPIIGLSASVFPEQVERCIEAGMSDFVAKPIDAELLLDKVAKAVAGRVRPAS